MGGYAIDNVLRKRTDMVVGSTIVDVGDGGREIVLDNGLRLQFEDVFSTSLVKEDGSFVKEDVKDGRE